LELFGIWYFLLLVSGCWFLVAGMLVPGCWLTCYGLRVAGYGLFGVWYLVFGAFCCWLTCCGLRVGIVFPEASAGL